MAAKMKKPTRKSAPQPGAVWRPRMESESEFNPFAGASAAGSHFADAGEDQMPVAVPDATQDTAPLQGSMDRSDADSVETVMSEPAPTVPVRTERVVRRPAAKPKAKAKARAKAKVKAKAKAKAKSKSRARPKAKAKSKRRTAARGRAAAAPARKKAKGRARAKK